MSSNVRVFWRPSQDSTVQTYQVLRASVQYGPFWLLGTVAVNTSGPNYDPATGRYFYDDATGDLGAYYQIVAYNTFSVAIAASTPFNPSGIQDTTLTNRTMVNQDYGGQDALRYLSPGGCAIPQAEIRIFLQADYMMGNTNTAYAVLMTKDDGRWATPVFLPPGTNYVVQFYKPSAYGPDIATITV